MDPDSLDMEKARRQGRELRNYFATHNKELMDRLLTPMKESVNYLKAARSREGGPASSTVSPGASSLTPSPRAAPAAKRHARGRAKTKASSASGVSVVYELEADFPADIDGREVVWIDDLVLCVSSATVSMQTLNNGMDTRLVDMVQVAISICLEFCWQGSVTFNGRDYSAWSALRLDIKSALQQLGNGVALFGAVTAHVPEDSRDGGVATASQPNALLAKRLVEAASGGDEETRPSAQPLPQAAAMATIDAFLAQPGEPERLKQFIQANMSNPVDMQPALNQAKLACWQAYRKNPQFEVTGPKFIAMFDTALNAIIPETWIQFAKSILSTTRDAEAFPECVSHLFPGQALVEQFLNMRASYLTPVPMYQVK